MKKAGLRQRGPYALRHSFATAALAAGVTTFELSRMMGTSLEMIEAHYGHLAEGRLDVIRSLLAGRSGVFRALEADDGAGGEA